jgi:hypothetical protein
VLRNSSTDVRALVWYDICLAMRIVGYDTDDRKDWIPDLR